jgi:hypothetical protein
VTAAPTRVSLFRYSPALILFAIVIADARQLSDPDLWGHVLWGRELLAHGSLPRGNPYSYSAPGYFVVLAMSETVAPVLVQAPILLIIALMLVPAVQFRPTLFDFLSLSAIIALLSRHNWRGSAPLWLAIPIVAIWSNLHGGFFVGIVVMGVYAASVLLADVLSGAGPRRGLGIIAITAAAAASTLCTLLIPARARHVVHAHSLAHEPDDALRDQGLATADYCCNDRAQWEHPAEVFRRGALLLRRRSCISGSDAERW